MCTMKKAYIETYGCQMNVNDTEVIFSILEGEGYERTESMEEADLIMANTCSVRDNAEQRIWGRSSSSTCSASGGRVWSWVSWAAWRNA